MKIYLVGGAVRDEKLGLPIKDNDYVVVGGTPEYFLNNGYKQVGADFPVFLHPETRDEYALARKERKVGDGYHGFTCDYDPSITLKDDLFRRDLTINAMAKDAKTGEIIDYFNGLSDLKDKKLRHVSDHFKEDPLRVLRVARFAARYKKDGFTIADETMKLMAEMVQNGELSHLSGERIKLETDKALLETNPEEYFYVLRDCGALSVVFPEIDNLFGVPQPKEHHPEIDTGIHTMMVIEQAKIIADKNKISTSDKLLVMWMALTHDLGKAATPKKYWPKHHGHEEAGVPLVDDLADRLKMSKQEREFCKQCSRHHLRFHRIKELSKKSVLDLFKDIGFFRKPHNLELLIMACKADALGRTGFENNLYPQENHLKTIADNLLKIDGGEIASAIKEKHTKKGNIGELINISIEKERISVIQLTTNILKNPELVRAQHHFMISIDNNIDKKNAIQSAKQIMKNKTSFMILCEFMDIDMKSEHIAKLNRFVEKLDAVNTDDIVKKYNTYEIGKEIMRQKIQAFDQTFDYITYPSIKSAIHIIQNNLDDSLLKKEFREMKDRNAFSGHCYVAAEALYHLCGGKSRFSSFAGRDANNITHWWLVNKETRDIIDPTAEQYLLKGEKPPYESGRACAFLTREPSKRCQILLDKIKQSQPKNIPKRQP